jgi:3-deoxy-D-manno-octulosonate 8-phosphate phosphatase (KDO 8-P phosphatase)
MQNLKYSDISYLIMDFDGVMTDDSVYVNASGVEMVRCSRFDGAGINLLKIANRLGFTNIEMLILSSEVNQVALTRSLKLGVKCETNIHNKFEFLSQRAINELRISPQEFFDKTIYFGNDLNDFYSMQASRFSFAPDNSHPKIKEVADIVLPEKGGHGFVRAAIEQVLGTTVIDSLITEIYA